MPKKFRFQLEALLRLRTIEEENALQEFSAVIQKINNAKRKVQELEEQYRKGLQQFKEYSQSEAYNLFYTSFERFLNRLESLKKQTEIYIESLQSELEEKRKKLVEARKNKKIIEKLKEKKWAEYIKDLNNKEKKEIFELNQKNIQFIKELHYELLEENTSALEEYEESSEDLRTRKERELREYYRSKGIPFTE